MSLNLQKNKLLSFLSLNQLLAVVTMLTIASVPLLFFKDAAYMYEFPKVIALSVLSPILLLLLRWIPEERHHSTGYLGVFIYILLGWLLFKSIFSLNPTLSFFGIYGNFTGFFFYLFSISFFFLGNHFRESKLRFLILLINFGQVNLFVSWAWRVTRFIWQTS